MVQPPALSAADLPGSRALVVEDVDRDDGPLPSGGEQSRLVVQPQILPEP
jgi:hypothetical protein